MSLKPPDGPNNLLDPWSTFFGSDTPQDRDMINYMASTGKFVFKDPAFIDPADGWWGPVGHLLDSQPAFQAAINYAIMGNVVDPALAGATPIAHRRPLYPVRIGGHSEGGNLGAYRLDTKLKIYAADGFLMEGCGALATRLRNGSAGQDYIIDLNGCHGACIRDISLETTDVAADCTAMINVDSITTVAALSGEFPTLENMWITGRCKYGVQIGASGPSNAQDTYQVLCNHVFVAGSQRIAKMFTADTHTTNQLTNVSVLTTGASGLTNGDTITGVNIPVGTTILSGAGTATITMSASATGTRAGQAVRRSGWDSSATLWQAGFKVGGPFGGGNVLSHHFHACNSSGFEHGVEWSSVGIHWRDGNTIANNYDFYTTAMNLNDPSIIEGDRSESSGHFLFANGGSTAVQLSIRDVAFNASVMDTDNTPIQYTMGGMLKLENFNIIGILPSRIAFDQVLIRIGAADGAQVIDIDGITVPMTAENRAHPRFWLTEAGTTRRGTWTVRNVKGYTDATTTIALDRPIAGPISNRDRTPGVFTFAASTVNTSTTLTSGNSTATANLRKGMTITHPNFAAPVTVVTHISGNDFQMSAAATATSSATAVITRYPMHESDKVITVTSTATGGHFIDLLPVASVHPGHRVIVIDESGSLATNNVTLDGSGAELIRNGATSAGTSVMSTDGETAEVMSTVTGWVRLQ